MNVDCYSYHPKGWPLRFICSILHSIDKETEAQSLEGTDFRSRGSSHLFSCPLASSKIASANYLGIQQLRGPTWILPSLLDYKKRATTGVGMKWWGLGLPSATPCHPSGLGWLTSSLSPTLTQH